MSTLRLPYLLPLLLTVAAASSAAHDTWFEAAGPGQLALGTGNRYPVHETAVGAEYLQAQGCRTAAGPGSERLMQAVRLNEHALVLRAPPRSAICWAQLVPLDIELDAAHVTTYLHEVQAPPAVLEAWRAMQARGLPWKERYVKHARVELASGQSDPQAVPLAMDVVREARAGGGWSFRVLRHGRPLPGQAVELISHRAQRGIWRMTDAQGRVAVPALDAGHWLLRGTHLRLSDDDPTRWESDFVTLAFEVPADTAVRTVRR